MRLVFEQDRRDQVSGNDEEYIDADKAALHPGQPGMEQNNRNDRNGAQAVDVPTV